MISEKKEEEGPSRLLTLISNFLLKLHFREGFRRKFSRQGAKTLMLCYFSQSTSNRKDGNLVCEDLKRFFQFSFQYFSFLTGI